MGIYIVNTCNMRHEIKEKEPYRSFLRKYSAIKDEDMDQGNNSICIDLARGRTSASNAFDIDRYYFSNPCCSFSYYIIQNCKDSEEKYLVSHTLEFEFDYDFVDTITDGLLNIKKKQKFIYLPGVDEFEIAYNIEQEKAALVINAVTDKKELIEEISMMLVSLDISLLARGW